MESAYTGQRPQPICHSAGSHPTGVHMAHGVLREQGTAMHPVPAWSHLWGDKAWGWARMWPVLGHPSGVHLT